MALRMLIFPSAVLLLNQRLASFAPGARRHTYKFFESAIECGFRFIADLGARVGEAYALFNEPRSKLQTPARHILYRRNLDKLGEPACKGGARETDLLRQLVEGPRLCRPAMDQTESCTDMPIAKPGQPAARVLG